MTSLDFRAMLEAERKAAAAEAAAAKPAATTSTATSATPTTVLDTHTAADKESSSSRWCVCGDCCVESAQPTLVSSGLCHGYKLAGIDDVWLVEDFVTPEESVRLAAAVYDNNEEWTQLTKRRLQNLGGIPAVDGMIEEPLPSWIHELNGRLLEARVFEREPNHCLLNEYKDGVGIGIHNDGPMFDPLVASLSLCSPAFINFYPRAERGYSKVADLSVYLPPRSLVVFCGAAFTDYAHGTSSVANAAVVANLQSAGENLQAVNVCEGGGGSSMAAGATRGEHDDTQSTVAVAEWTEPRLSLTLRVVSKLKTVFATAEGRAEAARQRAALLRAVDEAT